MYHTAITCSTDVLISTQEAESMLQLFILIPIFVTFKLDKNSNLHILFHLPAL